MKCPNCGTEQPKNAKFCRKCGFRLDGMTCPGCGNPVPSSARYCGVCGADLGAGRRKGSRKPKGKKSLLKKVLIVTLVLVVVTGGVAGLLLSGALSPGEQLSVNADIIEYPNGSTAALLDMDHIVIDEETLVEYIDNRLIVFTVGDLEADEASALADVVGGTIVGDISGMINLLQIQVEVSTLEELNKMADLLMEQDYVAYASYDYPISMEESGWSDKDKETGSWWVEAIGADIAWQFSDYCEPVTIGIIDSGFDLDHVDLTREDNTSVVRILDGFPTNSESDHGTHVTGIIAAQDNGVGMRGIADTANIVAADWSPTEGEDLTSTGQYAIMIEEMIEDEGVCVINNSWIEGDYVYSEKGYAKQIYYEKNEAYSVKGYYATMNSQGITVTGKEDAKGDLGDDTEYPFSANDIEHADFYINNELVTQASFRERMASDLEQETDSKGTIYLALEEGEDGESNYVTEVHYLSTDYDFEAEIKTLDYDLYMESVEAKAERSGFFSIITILQILEYSADHEHVYDDFLVVQAAGNGYDNGEFQRGGFDAALSGTFCAVDESLYDYLASYYPALFEGYDIDYQTIADHVMIVGAVNNEQTETGQYKMTSFSNYGDNVDICAPGQTIYSTITDNEYGNKNGTSMAAPMVSAAAALVWSLNPDLTAGEVKDILISTAGVAVGVTGEDAGREYPMLNVGSAVLQTVMGTITGTVVDGETGETMTGVTCTLTTDASDSDFFTTPTISGADDGSFTVSAVGNCTLLLEKDGYDPVELTVSVDLREDVDVGEVVMTPSVNVEELLSDESARAAYLQFLDNGEYLDRVGEVSGIQYAVYDVTGDGISELLLHCYSSGVDGTYYVYGYDGAVYFIGSCVNVYREGAYYSAEKNNLVIVANGDSDWISYEFYDVTDQYALNDQLTLTYEMGRIFYEPGTEPDTDDVLDGHFYIADGEGMRDVTESEWNSHINELTEIVFSDLTDVTTFAGNDLTDTGNESGAEVSNSAAVSDIVLDTAYTDDYYEFGNIYAYDSNGNLVWSYATGSYPATELDAISEIGLRDGRYYFVEGGTVVAMDASTGAVLWENSDFGSYGASAAFAENCICLAGYYGPDFYAVSYGGTTLCEISSFGSEYYWASNVTISGNTALVSLNDGYCEAQIDLATWSYAISDVG